MWGLGGGRGKLFFFFFLENWKLSENFILVSSVV